ncbi:MAG TPA: adenylate/guanylate cyclase domain-containing protein, partial [Polyangia bacterium]
LAALAALVLALSVRTSSAAVLRVGESARQARAAQVVASVEADLSEAERAIQDFERATAEGIVDDGDPLGVQRYLTAELIARRGLTELTLTSGRLVDYDEDGDARLGTAGRRQLSLLRDAAGGISRRVAADFGAGATAAASASSMNDPTAHDTFRAAAHRDARGQALWSDLAFAEHDAALPPQMRRKTLTVQKAVFTRDRRGAERFVGVLRAGIVSRTLDRLGAAGAGDPHRFFLCDTQGRLITRLGPDDPYVLVDAQGRPDPDGDLRVAPRALPPAIGAALAFARAGGTGGERMVVAGVPYFLSLVPVAEGRAQQWLLGVVVPETTYVGPLAAARDRLSLLLGIVVAIIGLGGLLGARTIGGGVRALVRSTEAMRRFSFEAAPEATSPFREVRQALESVERAKTALRAMVKYVPIDLVRRLYESGRDPILGAEPSEISVMFTDIADFTTHAESLSPDRLARALGRYLEVATRAVESAGGTVDKFIGDALMVLWNAPVRDDGHPASACRAALACAAAVRELCASSWWREAGLAPWRTRFGIHTDRVLVGNFGAPDRLSYTAMGDGVNLAARLEGLNKVYETTILVSGEVRRRAGEAFVFRWLDRVAVKGKSRPVEVHELVGLAGDPATEARRAAIAVHEEALAAAFAGRFADALGILGASVSEPDGGRRGDAGDAATRLLAVRCRAWLATPPPPDWDGTWAAPTK